MSFPDIEAELITFIDREIAPTDTAKSGLRTPAEWPASEGWAFHRVRLLPSPDDDVTAYFRVDIDTFAATRAAARDAAMALRDALAPRVRLGSATIDTVRRDALPHEVPWDNPAVRRLLATYQISMRR